MWQRHEAGPGRTEETKPSPPPQREAEFQAPAEQSQPEVEARKPEEHQVEEEHRKALEEEAMEQVGQAEHLEEEHDPSPEEQDREWKEEHDQKEDANLVEGRAHAEGGGHLLQVGPIRSGPLGEDARLPFQILKGKAFLYMTVSKIKTRVISLNVTCTDLSFLL